jgi:uracil-DNA glycosylase
VKVIMVGQDPYPNISDAVGLAFSVAPRKSGLPGSLMNIQKEIITDIGSTTTSDGDLSRWASQGVMLLNRILTVSAGESASHASLGWGEITKSIIEHVAVNGAIGVLWGNSAREMAPLFPEDNRIEGVHPSPLSAHRGFLGSKPFSRVNERLQAKGLTPIIW